MEFSMKQAIETMKSNGLHDEAAAVGLIIQQRDELLEACRAFLRYDEGDQEDGVQLMIDYADALALCKSAVANAEK